MHHVVLPQRFISELDFLPLKLDWYVEYFVLPLACDGGSEVSVKPLVKCKIIKKNKNKKNTSTRTTHTHILYFEMFYNLELVWFKEKNYTMKEPFRKF